MRALSHVYGYHPLVQFLRDPSVALHFAARDWERLLRAARQGYLSSRVAHLASQLDLIGTLPSKVEMHLLSAIRVSESQARSARWEVRQIQSALREISPFIILKGAAYILSECDAGNGRLMSDIDIMVPKSRLLDAEKALFGHGWFPTKLNAYDQKYYRTWMHELPPMLHLDRGTNLDVHHNILPTTGLLKLDAEKLWAVARPVNGRQDLLVLSPVDMVLHSATHLFHDGELEHGLRDLVDIAALLKQFSTGESFWESLVKRAVELNLTRPLYYALKYCREFIETPIPESTYENLKRAGRPSASVTAVMDAIVRRSIGGILEETPSFSTVSSRFAMYVRSHYLRMPMHLLIPHLLRKQIMPERHGV